MIAALRALILACGLGGFAGSVWSDVTFYEREDFRGRSFNVVGPIDNFARFGFNDRASSAVVRSGSYLVCEDAGYRGRCVTLGPGNYPSLNMMGLNNRISSTQPARSGGDGPRAVLFSQANFGGQRVNLDSHNALRDFARSGFNNRASSLRVERGHWMLCSGADFHGHCSTFGPGDYPHLPHELDNRVSSARAVNQSPEYRERRREPRDRN